MDTSDHLRRNEAAQYLRVSVRKLDALTAAEEIAAAKLGRVILYRRRDLDAFVASRLQPTGHGGAR